MPDFDLIFHNADVNLERDGDLVTGLTVKRRGWYHGKYFNRPIVEVPKHGGGITREQAMAYILANRKTDEPLCKTQFKPSMRLSLLPAQNYPCTTQL